MDETPKRRWYQFRLSTVLILTAIVAWGMVPQLVDRDVKITGHKIRRPQGTQIVRTVHHTKPFPHRTETWRERSPRVLGPALALALFLTWKAAWAVIERRREKRMIGSTESRAAD